MKKSLFGIAGAALILAISAAAVQAVELPNVFANHMVIQRDIKAPVWGKAAANSTVTVEFAGQKKTATADAGGKWMIKLDPMKANAKPQTMTVSEPPSVVTYEDVLVGDNWLCSGQSNMEFDMNGTTNSQQELADAVNYPTIRFFRATEHISTPTPLDNAPGTWNTLTPDSARQLTAVGYFFARRINKEIEVPIGVIQSAWGGSPIEPWTTPAGFRMVPELADFSNRIDMFDPTTTVGKELQKDIIKKVSEWLPAAQAAVDAGKVMPPVPDTPRPDGTCGMYNGMIAPLVPYGIKGALWYQGESNGGEGISYFQKMQALIGGWRKAFGVGDFPFYFVQLANFQAPNPNPEGGDGWAKVREAQRKSLEIPNTGMAVAIDLADAGNPGDIHPKNKQDVGGRLAQWALYQTYGKKDVVPSGPLFKSAAADGNKLTVTFNWVGGGLIVGEKKGLDPVKAIAGGTLKGFAIAGEDKKWVWADAKIVGKTVVLTSAECQNPVAVRYAFTMNPDTANLYNKEGLPASPFRSDDW
ncbi:MAG: sialate O-acetylesterase [Armatimonadetes bacterium]|nr:sialate O-acetylesterase [Armatimonadota bacterium]